MADRVLKLRKKAIITIDIWSVSSIFVLLCSQLPFYALASENYRSNIFIWVPRIIYIWTAFLASAGLFNLVAFAQVTKLLVSRKTNNVKCEEDPDIFQTENGQNPYKDSKTDSLDGCFCGFACTLSLGNALNSHMPSSA